MGGCPACDFGMPLPCSCTPEPARAPAPADQDEGPRRWWDGEPIAIEPVSDRIADTAHLDPMPYPSLSLDTPPRGLPADDWPYRLAAHRWLTSWNRMAHQ